MEININKLLRIPSFFTLVFFSTLFSCGDDDPSLVEEDVVLIAIDNPDEITAALTIEGATLRNGTPPLPTADFNAPFLDEAEGDLLAITGSELIIPVDEETASEVAGVYIQVKGASDYFDVPASSLGSTGGRSIFGKANKNSRKQQDIAVYIGLPDNLSPGEFCVLYCVYDQENRISNIVEVCIEVLSFGGEGSEFLTANTWEMTSQSFYEEYDGFVYSDTTVVGFVYEEIYNYPLHCEGQPTQNVEVTLSYKINYLLFTLTSDGGFQVEESEYKRNIDFENTNCAEGLIYDEEIEINITEGAWSYNSQISELILISTYEDFDGSIRRATVVSTLSAYQENGNLILVFEEGTKGSGTYSYSETIFSPS